MFKFIRISLIIFPLLFTGFLPQEQVLICNSPSAYAYHNSYCRGLNNCKHDVLQVTISKACNNYKKCKPCGYCY
jgi:hypothetical protein